MDPTTIRELEQLSGTRQLQVHMRARVWKLASKLAECCDRWTGTRRGCAGTDRDLYQTERNKTAPNSLRASWMDDFDRLLPLAGGFGSAYVTRAVPRLNLSGQ